MPLSDSAGNSTGHVFLAVAVHAKKLTGLIYGGYIWVLLVLIVLPAYASIILSRDKASQRRIARSAARLLFCCAGVQLKSYGLETLPTEPHLLIVNHTSFVDALALTALLPASPGYAFTARQQFRAQSVFCPLLRSLGTIILHPHDARHASNTELLTATLAHGKNLIIFPEGGFRPEPGLCAFHLGAFVAAAKAQVPVVVAGLRGTRQALRPGTWLPRRTLIELEIGPVIVADRQDPESIARLRHAARKAMLPLTCEGDLTVRGADLKKLMKTRNTGQKE